MVATSTQGRTRPPRRASRQTVSKVTISRARPGCSCSSMLTTCPTGAASPTWSDRVTPPRPSPAKGGGRFLGTDALQFGGRGARHLLLPRRGDVARRPPEGRAGQPRCGDPRPEPRDEQSRGFRATQQPQIRPARLAAALQPGGYRPLSTGGDPFRRPRGAAWIQRSPAPTIPLRRHPVAGVARPERGERPGDPVYRAQGDLLFEDLGRRRLAHARVRLGAPP